MARVARLGIAVDSKEAVSGIRQTEEAVERLAAKAKRLEDAMAAEGKAARESGRVQAVAAAEAQVAVERKVSAVLRSTIASGSAQTAARQMAAAFIAEATAAGTATAATAGLSGALATLGGPIGIGVVIAMQGLDLITREVAKRHEAAEKAAKEQAKALDEATEAARRYREEEANGFAANVVRRMQIKRAEIEALSKAIEDAEKENRVNRAGAAGSGTGVFVTSVDTSPLIEARRKALDDLETFQREFNALQLDQEKSVEGAKVRERNALIKGDQAIAADREAAIRKLEFDLARMKRLRADAARGVDNVAERAALAAEIKAIQDALGQSAKDRAAAETKAAKEQAAANKEAKEAAAAQARETAASDALLYAGNERLRAGLSVYVKEREKEYALSVAIAAKRAKEEATVRAMIDAQADELNLIGRTAKERRLLQENTLVFALMDKGYTLERAELFVREQRFLEANKAATKSWGESLKELVGIAQLLGTVLGENGRTLTQAATGAQSILGGIGAAGNIKNADGERIGLRAALSGSGGAAGVVAGLGATGAVVGGLAQIAVAMDLFGTRARERSRQMRQSAEDFNAALDSFAISTRGSLEEQLRANTQTANDLAKKLRTNSPVRITSSADVDRLLADEAAAWARGFGQITTGASQTVTALRALSETMKDNERIIRERLAAELAVQNEDLAIRRLVAQGRQAEADALRLQIAQARELDEAQKYIGVKGFADFIKNLKEVQDAEAAAAAAAEELAQAERALTQARQQAAFAGDLVSRRQALNGDSRGAFVTRQTISGASELAAAEDLLKAGVITQEMFAELARILNDELAAALREMEDAARAAAEAAAAERQSKFDDLAVRELVAKGDENGAARLRRELQNKKELEGVNDIVLMGEILRVQALEEEAIRLAELAQIEAERARQNDDITRRMIDAYRVLDPAKADELEQIREQIQREELLRDAVDEATRARYEELFALEDQAKAMKKLADEQKAAADAAEKLANLTATVEEEWLRATGRGFDADVKALERRRDERIEEAKKAGASEETIRQIREIFNANYQALIASTMQAATPEQTGPKAAEMTFQQQSVSRSISGLEALRLIDVSVSQLAVLRQIAANTAKGTSVAPVPPTDTSATNSNGLALDDAADPLNRTFGRRLGVERRALGISAL